MNKPLRYLAAAAAYLGPPLLLASDMLLVLFISDTRTAPAARRVRRFHSGHRRRRRARPRSRARGRWALAPHWRSSARWRL